MLAGLVSPDLSTHDPRERWLDWGRARGYGDAVDGAIHGTRIWR